MARLVIGDIGCLKKRHLRARYNLGVHYLILIPFWQKYCCENKLSNGSLMFTSSSHFLCAAEQNTETQYTHTHTHTHPFNGPLSRTTRVSRYQKGKTNLDFTEARDSEWQWHQLGHMHGNTIIAKNRLIHVVVTVCRVSVAFYASRRRGALSDTAIRPSVCPVAQLPYARSCPRLQTRWLPAVYACADPSADGRRSAASRTAVGGGHIVSPRPGR